MLESAGAVLDVEIDDQGERVPADGKTGSNEVLIVGKIPDPTKSQQPDEKKIDIKIGMRLQELKSEALEQGVRIVNMNSFQEEYDLLDFVGFKAKRRLWQPGVSDQWNLKKGARSTGVAPRTAVMGAESTGQTSGLYRRDRRVAPQEPRGKRANPRAAATNLRHEKRRGLGSGQFRSRIFCCQAVVVKRGARSRVFCYATLPHVRDPRFHGGSRLLIRDPARWGSSHLVLKCRRGGATGPAAR
jgi:hypothetical protein